MTFDISDRERELLLDLFQSDHKKLLHELHHTSTFSFKQLLKEKIKALEELNAKVEGLYFTKQAA